MKIPTYDSTVQPSSGTPYRGVADVRSDTFSEIAKGIDAYAERLDRDNAEALKTEYYKADTAIRYELDKGYSEMVERIKNGGAYGKAEAEYQKLYDGVIKKYGRAFEADPNVRERSMAEYKRMGLEQTLRLKNVVQARRKSDAVFAANLAINEFQRQYFDAPDEAARAAVLGKVSKTMAGLTAVGAIDQNEARVKITNFAAQGELLRFNMALQDNNTQQAEEILSKAKGILDPETFVRMRGSVISLKEKLDFVDEQKAAIYGESVSSQTGGQPTAATKPVKITQNGVDAVLQENIERLAKEAPDGRPPQELIEQEVIDLALRSRMMPTQIAEQASVYLGMDPQQMDASDYATAASMARVISTVNDSGIKIKSNLDKKLVAKAELMYRRMENGMSAQKAYTTVSSVVGETEESFKLFNQTKEEVNKLFLGKKVSSYEFDMSDIPQSVDARSEWGDLYSENRTLGASVEEAADMATKQIKKTYQKFNGVVARDPITRFINISEREAVSMAQSAFAERSGLQLGPGERLVVAADGIAKKKILAGEPPSFPVLMSIDGSEPVAVIDTKTGRPLRIMVNEQKNLIKETTVQKRKNFEGATKFMGPRGSRVYRKKTVEGLE